MAETVPVKEAPPMEEVEEESTSETRRRRASWTGYSSRLHCHHSAPCSSPSRTGCALPSAHPPFSSTPTASVPCGFLPFVNTSHRPIIGRRTSKPAPRAPDDHLCVRWRSQA